MMGMEKAFSMDSQLPHASGSGSFSPIDFPAELNPQQLSAVTVEPGPSLVLAGAGTGKTRTLTYRVAWLLTQGISPGEILLLTFTNKAAREMLQRVEDLTSIPGRQFWGGTFHHCGQRTLRIFGELIGLQKRFTILDEGDAQSLLGSVIRDLDSSFLKNKENPKPRVIAGLISYSRNTRKDLSDVIAERFPWNDEIGEPINQFASVYRSRKLERQVADFDDLLEYWLKLLEEFSEVAEYFSSRFQFVLVDEYQDTNRIQAEIIDRVATHHRIMAVGDDAQCIYTWRGAEYQNIMSFAERHPGTQVYKIEINYRSTPEILGLANTILASQELGTGYPKVLQPSRSPRVTPYVVPLVDGLTQARFIIERIAGLLDEGFRYRDIAVLYRAHYQALDLQIELTKRSIPFIITSGVKFFEQAHIRDLVAQLRFVSNPRDVTAFARFACLLPRVGERTAYRIHQTASEAAKANQVSTIKALSVDTVTARVPADAKEEWKDLVLSLADVEESISTQSPGESIQIAIDGWYGDFLRNIYTNWESRKDDLTSLIGFASRFDDMADLLAQLALLNSETSDRSVDRDEDCLRLTTIHQAKGLEFPVVFLIGVADGLLPLKRAVDNGDIEEERRLFYVAVTRARDELYLTYPRINTHGGPSLSLQPSRFLLKIPPQHIQTLRYQSFTGFRY